MRSRSEAGRRSRAHRAFHGDRRHGAFRARRAVASSRPRPRIAELRQPFRQKRVSAAGLVALMVPESTRTPIRKACSEPTTRAWLRTPQVGLRLGGRKSQPIPKLAGDRHAVKVRGSRTASSRWRRRDQDLRETRRRSHDVRNQPSRPGLSAQQRKELHTGRQLGKETVEAGKALSGSRFRPRLRISAG